LSKIDNLLTGKSENLTPHKKLTFIEQNVYKYIDVQWEVDKLQKSLAAKLN